MIQPNPKPASQPRRLTRDLIVQEAIVLLNEGGLDNVSLRKIAARLDVRAPSLARHVGDKAQLLALVSGTIFGQALDDIPAGLRGDDWLMAFGRALHKKQEETRDIFALLGTAPPDATADGMTSTRLEELMRQAGLEGSRAQLEQSAIQALVTGWTTFEKSARAALFQARLPSQSGFDDSLAALIAGFNVSR